MLFKLLTSGLSLTAGNSKYIEHLKGEKATFEQQVASKDAIIENLQKDQHHWVVVESGLTEGAIVAASHAVCILKSHIPDLDVSILSKGYGCTEESVRDLLEENRPIVEAFVDKLAPSVSDSEE